MDEPDKYKVDIDLETHPELVVMMEKNHTEVQRCTHQQGTRYPGQEFQGTTCGE